MPSKPEPGQRAVHGLALGVEDLGLEHDVDDDTGHGRLLGSLNGSGRDQSRRRRPAARLAPPGRPGGCLPGQTRPVPGRRARARVPATCPHDPHLWLEDVLGEDQLAWVREQNARTDAELAGDDDFAGCTDGVRGVLDSDDNIPFVRKVGDYLYNFWQDAAHERGLWRRTTLDVLPLRRPRVGDAARPRRARRPPRARTGCGTAPACLRPDLDRCLVALSRGGADADVTREFDLTTLTWVEGGFVRPEAKGDVAGSTATGCWSAPTSATAR